MRNVKIVLRLCLFDQLNMYKILLIKERVSLAGGDSPITFTFPTRERWDNQIADMIIITKDY